MLDFGVAKLARHDEGSRNGDWTVEPVTAVGSVVGSAPYMSPEQIVGGDADSRSDVFSLGVVIYEMATGQLPFSGSTRAEMVHRILHAAPERMMRLHRISRPSWNGSRSSVSTNAETPATSRGGSC